ncbi:zinc-dependent alcohol dehydrogenase [Pullulanibacillus pueri]|uniref:Galactitol-1-phosphate 5-dehydrogenase n=1 Tax=Pullulanibacillus pueri TaxID=1437324 RepID=A0A8J3EK18_9BACL|nr:galactitol-1-phosphate 5-dehydrogenase [Pullulanibacillus pueri]GGH73719.1 galactitol-1-phosphate 5-dehydrogenase [Pullulanibacillus pueri]
MKALVYEGPKLMNIREQPVPVPKKDEVLIRVERAGICGSELGGYLGQNSLRHPPLVMGHEFSGTIAQVGEAVTRFQISDRVTANPLISCGICGYCQSGREQLCQERKLLGAHCPGAYAEYVVVPEKNTYLLQDHVSFEEGAFTEPFACAVHICRLLSLKPSDQLLIVGAGPIGLFTLIAAQVMGLRHIVVIDLNEGRLEIAREMGARAVPSLDALGQESANRGFDAAVDAVGLAVTRSQCMTSVKSGGHVIFTGLHEADSRLPINTIIRNEVSMHGSFAYSHDDFETALHWIEDGKVHLEPWTLQAPLEEGGACFEHLIGNAGKIAKILLTMA